MNGINSATDLFDIVFGMNDKERNRRLYATLNALKSRLADAQDEKTKKWLKKKMAIVEKRMDRFGLGH